ncbi:MAG: VOC family protein [Opitutaceae bacterium]|jgi:lactoylglutathione lyase
MIHLRFSFVLLTFCLSANRLPADGVGRNFHIYSLYHVGFWVRDIGKSRAFYKTYLGFDEPYGLNHPDGSLQLVVMKVNERQVIYLFPNASKILPNGDNLDHLGLETDNVAGLRDYLAIRGVGVGPVQRARIGDLILTVRDPDGHAIEFTQFEPEGQLLKHQGEGLATTRISKHLLSATIAVANEGLSLHFYHDILGFKEIRQDGRAGGAPSAIRLRVPDGTDYFDLQTYEKKLGAEPPRAVAQFCLEVPDAAEATLTLTQRAKECRFPPPIVENKQEISCLDPDGARVVLLEDARRQ